MPVRAQRTLDPGMEIVGTNVSLNTKEINWQVTWSHREIWRKVRLTPYMGPSVILVDFWKPRTLSPCTSLLGPTTAKYHRHCSLNRNWFLIILRLEIHSQSVSRVSIFWGLSPCLIDTCLLPSPFALVILLLGPRERELKVKTGFFHLNRKSVRH